MTADLYFFGGAGDRRSGIVYGYWRRLFEGRAAHYFQHFQGQRALGIARGGARPVVLVGHSWGADAAARLARRIDRPVTLLVGVDPVAKPFSRMLKRTARMAGTEQVITVDGGPEQVTPGDRIKAFGAAIGGGWPTVFDAPDTLIHAPCIHDDFAHMFEAPGPDGRSAADHVRMACRVAETRAGKAP